jgi:hypothetical protein
MPARPAAATVIRAMRKMLTPMGLRQATGRPYESFVFLLEELTR